MHTYNPVTQKEETLVNSTRLKDAMDGLKADSAAKVAVVAADVTALSARVEELRQAPPVVTPLHDTDVVEGFTMKHHTIYKVLPGDASYDFSALDAEAYATAEMHFEYASGMGEVTWNPDWLWLSGSAPTTFTDGYVYCFIIRNDGYGTMANLAYERAKPAPAEPTA